MWALPHPLRQPKSPGDRRLTRSRAKVRTTYSARVSVFTSVILMSPYMSESSGQYREHFTCSPTGQAQWALRGAPGPRAPSPRSPAYPAHFHQLGDHDNAGTVLLPHQAPEVVDHLRLRPWRRRGCLSRRPGLHPGPAPLLPSTTIPGQVAPESQGGLQAHTTHTPPTADSCPEGPRDGSIREGLAGDLGHLEGNPGGRSGGPWHKSPERMDKWVVRVGQERHSQRDPGGPQTERRNPQP